MTEFITRCCGKKEFEIIIKTDSYDHYEATQKFARQLIDHAKPMTNADRIRAMSDEELAVYWADHYDNFCRNKPECARVLDGNELIPDAWCVACALEWLQQPAELPASDPDEDKEHSGLIEEE